MPGQEDSYDLIRVQDAQANSKADTFFISPKELGTDETQVRRVVLEALDGDMTGGVEVSSLTGDKLSVDSSGNLTASGVGPDDAEYVVLSSDPDLANAQVHANLSGSDLHDPSDHALGGGSHSADTLAKLNSLVSNATLDDTGDARDPTTHGTTHQNGGSDELNVEGLSGDLADAQDPKSHSTTHENGGGDELAVDGLSGDLADAQDPKAHTSTHTRQGSDTVAVDELGGDDYLYAASFPGIDPDARLDNALASSGVGDTIYLENAEYNADHTIATNGITLIGGGTHALGSRIQNSTFEFTGTLGHIENVGLDTTDGSVNIRLQFGGQAVNIRQGGGKNGVIEAVASNCIITRLKDVDVTLNGNQCVVDSSVDTTVTDNGNNNVIGDIA
jgi:hypothetical protein